MSKNLIVKDNALINASYNLELIEQRLILLAIGQSRKIGQDFNAHSRLKISVSDYINIYSTHGKSVYENIKKSKPHHNKPTIYSAINGIIQNNVG